MFIRFLAVVGLFVSVLLCPKNQSVAVDVDDTKPLEPEVAPASDEPQDAMNAIRLPKGWKIELFAAEPDVANVVAIDVDNRGRVYIAETFRQNKGVTDNRGHDEQWLLADLAAKTVQDRIDYHKRLLGEAAVTYAQHDDRIRRLVDTDGDNRADQSTVLANGFNGLEEGTGAGLLVRGNSVYYTCIPKLWKLIDQDDDGVADESVVLSDGYGVRVAFRGHDLHGATMGPDGRLYFSIGDRGYHITTSDGRVLDDPASGAVFRCELDGSHLEVFAHGLRNPQELAFNDVGDLFSVDNNSDSGDQARIVHILRDGDTGWRMYYQYLPDRGPFNRERLWEPFHDEQAAYIVPPIMNFTDGPSGLVFYPGTGFGDTLKNKFLICDFRGGPANSGIRSFELTDNGATYQMLSEDQPIWTCLATDVAFGPDGAMYISDWVDGWDGLGKGRVYRVSDPSQSESEVVADVREWLGSDWTSLDKTRLATGLAHPDRRIRLESQWELASRGEHPVLLDALRNPDVSAVARLHAVWGLGQIARLNKNSAPEILSSLEPFLSNNDGNLKAAVANLMGELNHQSAASNLMDLLKDTSPRVRYFAAMALADLKATRATKAVVSMLSVDKNQDPALRHAGMTFLSKALKPAQLSEFKSHTSRDVRRAAVVALRRQNAGELMVFLDDPDPLVVLEAARAIHDVPVPVALPALAKLIGKDLSKREFVPKEKPKNAPIDTPLARRVLNANYRLGSADNAIAIAGYATQVSSPLKMRIEALDMLEDWARPDPRDRVLNDHRELEPRKLADAVAALTPKIDLLASSDAEVREKMIEVASKLGIKKIVPMLEKRFADKNLGNDVRAATLVAISRLNGALAVGLAKKVDMTSTTSLVPAALDVLAKHDKTQSVSVFLRATEHRDQQVRQKSWDILATVTKTEVTNALESAIDKYMDGNLPADVQLNVLEAANGRISKELAARLSDFQAKLSEKDPLGKWLVALEGGDASKGSDLFFNKTELSCVRCHKVDRAGGNVGPELTTIAGQRDRRYLLEAICLPNAQIAKGFETAVIADEDGAHTGIVKTENDDYVELIKSDGSVIRIDQDAIEARKRGNSSMPADLIKQLSNRELRDLVEYLSSLKKSSRRADDVE